MKRSILAILSIVLFSCSKDVEQEDRDTEVKKAKITEVLVSNGINSKNVKFSDSITKENALVFNSIEEFEVFLKKRNRENKKERVLNNAYYNYEPHNGIDEDSYDKNSVGESFSISHEYNDGLYLIFNVSGNYEYEKENNRVLKSNVVSYMTGFMLGLSYEHIFGNVDGSDGNFYFSGEGVIKCVLFVEDIGTVYSEKIGFSGNTKVDGMTPISFNTIRD